MLPDNSWPPKKAENKPDLHTYWLRRDRLPACAQDCPTLLRHLELICPLDWAYFLIPAPNHPLHFNAPASLPTVRYLTQMLRDIPNAALQFLLADSLRRILAELAARQAARAACPHMLMPTPGSPEHFQEALAGRMPTNFDKLPKVQRSG